jgi:hypothetical protein
MALLLRAGLKAFNELVYKIGAFSYGLLSKGAEPLGNPVEFFYKPVLVPCFHHIKVFLYAFDIGFKKVAPALGCKDDFCIHGCILGK